MPMFFFLTSAGNIIRQQSPITTAQAAQYGLSEVPDGFTRFLHQCAFQLQCATTSGTILLVPTGPSKRTQSGEVRTTYKAVAFNSKAGWQDVTPVLHGFCFPGKPGRTTLRISSTELADIHKLLRREDLHLSIASNADNPPE